MSSKTKKLSLFWTIVLSFIVTALWGFNYPIVKVTLTDVPTFLVLFIRFFLMSLCLWPFFPKPPSPMKQLIPVMLSFCLGHLVCMYLAMEIGLSSGNAVIFQQVGIPILMILGVIIFKERISIINGLGALVSISGITILFHHPAESQPILGYLLMCGSGFFWALYSVLLKKVQSQNALAIVVWVGLLGMPCFFLLSLLTHPQPIIPTIMTISPLSWGGIIYMIVGSSLIAHGLWTFLIQRADTAILAPMILLVPIFGVLGRILFLNEPTTIMTIIGISVVLIGLIFSIQKKL